tara:strand:+ start:22 stop:621 length:600 start_codon:yes stop_codon:yes gene_type:complete
MKKFLVIALYTYGSLFAFAPLKANEKQINLASIEDEYYEIERAKEKEEECFNDKVRRSWFGKSYYTNDWELNGYYTILVYDDGIELWTKTFSNNYKCKNTAFFKWDTTYYYETFDLQLRTPITKEVIFKKPNNGPIIYYSKDPTTYVGGKPVIKKLEINDDYANYIFHLILTKLSDGRILDVSTGEYIRAKKNKIKMWW